MAGLEKTRNVSGDIAVVGIGCRFPGGIRDLGTFWDVLSNNKDVISKMPEDRLGNLEEIVDSQRGYSSLSRVTCWFIGDR